MIIAIDGPAASGKSTAARALADRLGLVFLDTGAMYRAVTHRVLEAGVDLADEDACTEVAKHVPFALDLGRRKGDVRSDEGRLLVDGAPPGPELRTSRVTSNVSQVAAHSGVRRVLVARQQQLGRAARAAGGGVVAEGRDTTTVVFPDADHKFFLIASAAERARRRSLEEGTPERAAEVQADIERRDAIDSTRADSPLRQAEDALRIETDGIGADGVLEAMIAAVTNNARGGAPRNDN